MQKIFLKIHSYDEQSKSLLVSFRSDVSKNTIDSYPSYAFQLQNLKGSTSQDIINELLVIGKSIAENQDKQENITQQSNIVNVAKALVGSQHNANVDIIESLNPSGTNFTGIVK